MPFTEDPDIAEQERRLVRLGQARRALEVVKLCLGQMERRAPELRVIISNSHDNLREAMHQIEKEFADTQKERGSR